MNNQPHGPPRVGRRGAPLEALVCRPLAAAAAHGLLEARGVAVVVVALGILVHLLETAHPRGSVSIGVSPKQGPRTRSKGSQRVQSPASSQSVQSSQSANPSVFGGEGMDRKHSDRAYAARSRTLTQAEDNGAVRQQDRHGQQEQPPRHRRL